MILNFKKNVWYQSISAESKTACISGQNFDCSDCAICKKWLQINFSKLKFLPNSLLTKNYLFLKSWTRLLLNKLDNRKHCYNSTQALAQSFFVLNSINTKAFTFHLEPVLKSFYFILRSFSL